MIVHNQIRIIVPLFLSLVLPSCAGFGIYEPGRRGPGGPPGQSGAEVSVTVGISIGEARELAIRYQLTNMRALPPGIRRNLARGKPLPPGIARHRVPNRMRVELPVVSGHEWRIAGRDLILIAVSTLIVVEILEDVFE
jgi:hypothetical protein